MVKNIDLKENSRTDEENLTLSQLFSIFLRRKKLFSIVTFFFFSGSVLFTIYQRTTNPIFRGDFAIMTSDPIGSEAFVGESSLAFQTLANNKSKVDFATLRIFLKSPLALNPLADEMNLPIEFLENIITIKDTSKSRTPGNVINVSINLKDYKLGKKLISKLSKNYMKLAVDTRQKRLNDGLDFLNSQVPSINQKRNEVKSKLSDYRKKYTFIEPTFYGLSIQDNIKRYKEYIKNINLDLISLKELKNDVESGRLTSMMFQEKFGDKSQNYGLTVKNANSSILAEALKLEAKLEEQKAAVEKTRVDKIKALATQYVSQKEQEEKIRQENLQKVREANAFEEEQMKLFDMRLDGRFKNFPDEDADGNELSQPTIFDEFISKSVLDIIFSVLSLYLYRSKL